MKRKGQISGGVCLIISFVVIQQSLGMDLGALRTPGPGFLPLILGIVLALLSGVIVFKSSLRTNTDVYNTPLAVNISYLKRFGFTVVVLLAFTFVFPHLGFFFSVFWLLFFLLRDPQKKWFEPLLGAGMATAASYFLFEVFLQIQFPSGPWWRLWRLSF